MIDGITIIRSSNTISDALAGVTLNVSQAELGTTVNLVVARDSSAAVQAVKDFVSAYNTASSFVATNTSEKGPLAFDTRDPRHVAPIALRDVRSDRRSPEHDVHDAAHIGLSLDKTGKMQLDESVLKAALADNPTEVKAFFATLARRRHRRCSS